MSETRPNDGRPLDRVLRVLLPVAALAAGVLIWELVVRLTRFRPTCCPALGWY